MPQHVQIIKPQKLNLDKSLKALAEDECYYILNQTALNAGSLGKSTPLPSNYLACEIEMPAGENYVIGSYYSELTNETYVFVANTNNAHFIYRMNGEGLCEIVNDSDCLTSVFGVSPEVFNPKHSFEQWRVYLRVEKICANRHGKELIFTNGLGNIGCIDVEASIATNSFTGDFFERCSSEGCETVELCVPKSCNCVVAEFIPLAEDEEALSNRIIDVGFKFIFRHIYYDLRASEWSQPSSLYYQDSKGCFSNTVGFPRCLQLTIPIGNPLVDKIEVGYSTDNGVNWLLADTIEKYDSYTSSSQYWYERDNLNPDLELTEDECSFYYNFCNDKQCQAIDPLEVSRVYNPLPRQAQGFVNIKGLLGFYNFIQGSCPLDRQEVDKFQVELNCPLDENCTTEYVTVKVRVVCHNFFYNSNTPVYRRGGLPGAIDDVKDPAFFSGGAADDGIDTYNSTFVGTKRNFTAYIEGTDYFVQMKQWRADEGFVNKSEVGIVSGVASLDENAQNDLFRQHSWYWYEEAVFSVRKGTKGFIRIMSHASASNNSNTSTYVKGTLADISSYSSQVDVNTLSFNEFKYEIFFDTSGGNVDLLETFVIEDLFKDSDLFNHSSAGYFGYLKLEDGTPIEFAELWRDPDRWMVTDHNGFFFRAFDDIDPDFDVRVETDCGPNFNTIKNVTLAGSYGGANQTDITLLDTETTAYRDDFLLPVNITVRDCDNNPVSGIKIALSNSKSRSTDADGIAHFEIRNKSERDRIITAVIMDGKGCFQLNCDDECNAPIESETQETETCYNTPEVSRDINLSINTSNASLSKIGLKKGGRYGFGIVAEGKCGRISASYELKNGYINIPKLQADSNTDFCSLLYNAGNILLPEWVDCLHIVMTDNLNPYELQWIVDKVERTFDGKIKLTIQSLNDYNAAYFFKTNSVYKYLKGDRVEFIRNGDGQIFTIAQYGLLNYLTLSPFQDESLNGEQSDVDYFNQLLIEDDGKLGDLVEGAVIEIQRQRECVNEPAYHSICMSLAVEDGQVVNQTGEFAPFDTYLVNRIIGENYQRTFEHHSPSDFWGEKLNSFGKAYFVNKYENERRYGRSIILNADIEFNKFYSSLIKTFDAPEQGDITAMTVIDAKVLQGISEFDNFLAQVSDTLVRIGADGLVRAAQPDQIITDAEPKLLGQFGCKYNSIGSVFFGDGFTTFVDITRSAFVRHNYSLAENVAINKVSSFFQNKCIQIQQANSLAGTNYINHYRFASGQNGVDESLYLTLKTLAQSEINNTQSIYEQNNITITYHPKLNEWLGIASFTPEHYSRLNTFDVNGTSFIVFFRGQAYIHPIKTTSWNEFFGTACDEVISVALNKFPEKIKKAVAIELQSDKMFYVSKVVTDKPTYLSAIPPKRLNRREDLWEASFLGNINSLKGLYGNETPRGYVTGITLVRDNTLNLAVNAVDNTKRRLFSEIDLILIKFSLSENSGMTENL